MRRTLVRGSILMAVLALACGGDPGPGVTTDTPVDPGPKDTAQEDIPTVDPGTDSARPDTTLPDDGTIADPGPDGTPPVDATPEDGTPGDTGADTADVEPDVPAPACENSQECETLLTGLGPCEVPVCDPSSDTCLAFVLVDNTPCGVPDACQPVKKCKAGQCVGAELDCDDGNPCTDDSCAPATGCAHLANAMDCNDGNPCTKDDACADKACVGGPNECACEVDGDCDAQDDGDKCNGRLVCVGVACVPDPETVVTCDPPPQFPCLVAACNPETGQCETEIANNGGACEDGSFCTTDDLCVRGECQGGPAPDCNDLNACTDDWCEHLEGCKHRDNESACDDGSACTVGDLCVGGACRSGASANCTDGNPCTEDTCDPATGCVRPPIEGPCEDGNACTVNDACQAGKCTAVATLLCDDGNPCTTDTCDPATGCVFTNNALACEDGNACTTGDKCSAGGCVAGGPVDCDDGKECTVDSCDPLSGCKHDNLQGTLCSDGNACTDGDACNLGQCVPGSSPLDCDDGESCTTDSCLPLSGCSNVTLGDGVTCDDGNGCTTGDKCTGGQCAGAGQNCDDGNPCTDDGCTLEVGCTHYPNAKACDDGNACTVGDTCGSTQCQPGSARKCDDGNLCTTDGCVPATGCVYENNALACDDGSACTGGDKCSAGKCVGSNPVLCFDGNPCTSDACVPATGCAFTPLADDTSCSDGQFCTVNDKCAAGQCVGATSNACDDGNVCTSDSCSESSDLCLHLPNSVSCTDTNTCTHGDTCSSGACKSGELISCAQPNPTCYNSATTPCVCIAGFRPVVCSEKGANSCLPKAVPGYDAGCYCGKNPQCGSLLPYCVCSDPRDPDTCACKLKIL